MTLSKYNEVMDNIKVTDEMRRRILLNIEKEVAGEDNSDNRLDIENKSDSYNTNDNFGNDNSRGNITDFNSGKKNSNNVVKFIRMYGSRVAIFALIVAGSVGVIKTVGLHSTQSSEMAATATQEEAVDSAYMEEATESAEATEDYAAATEAAEDSYKEVTESAALDAEDLGPMNEALNPVAGASKSENGIIKSNKGDNSEKALEDSKSEKMALASAKDLSKAIGFEIDDIKSLKDKAKDTEYLSYENGGEIRYKLSDDQISYFASEDESFINERAEDITSLTDGKLIEAGEKSVLIYGEDDAYKVAYWEEDDIWYSIVSDKGMTEDEIVNLIK